MSRRAAWLDHSIGETRAVVTLNGEPERLIIERDGEQASQRLGARSVARITAVRRAIGLAYLSMPSGPDAVAPLRPDEKAQEGASHEVVVVAEARAGKGAVVRLEAQVSGPPHLLEEAPNLLARLEQWTGGRITTGDNARELADEAQELVLDEVHPLPGGGTIAIETTRALTAIDVDVGEAGGHDAAVIRRRANLAAIGAGARLLRLKGLGGLVVFDLAGRGFNGQTISAAAREAFAPEGSEVAIGPISRFGLFELALPWRITPLAERLCGEDGKPSALTSALALLRAIEREARLEPGARVEASCSPQVGEAIKPFVAELADRIGARFLITVHPPLANRDFQVRCL